MMSVARRDCPAPFQFRFQFRLSPFLDRLGKINGNFVVHRHRYLGFIAELRGTTILQKENRRRGVRRIILFNRRDDCLSFVGGDMDIWRGETIGPLE